MSIRYDPSHRCASPAWWTGVTLSSKTFWLPRPNTVSYSLAGSQNSKSWRVIRYVAFGKVGTQARPSSRVFQPTWSMCRWVLTTTSTSSGRTPAAARLSR